VFVWWRKSFVRLDSTGLKEERGTNDRFIYSKSRACVVKFDSNPSHYHPYQQTNKEPFTFLRNSWSGEDKTPFAVCLVLVLLLIFTKTKAVI
jgi:hypothetical protein